MRSNQVHHVLLEVIIEPITVIDTMANPILYLLRMLSLCESDTLIFSSLEHL